MNKKGNITTTDAIEWNKIQFLINQLINGDKTNNDLNSLFLITAGAYCGLRFSDIRELRYSDFETKNHTIIEKKTKKNRLITWNQKILEVVSFIKNHKLDNSNYILTNKKGKQLSIQYAIQLLKSICIENHISGAISTHSLRKSFGLRVYSTNNSSEHALVLLSDLFGHSSLRITRTYLGIREEEKQSVYLGL